MSIFNPHKAVGRVSETQIQLVKNKWDNSAREGLILVNVLILLKDWHVFQYHIYCVV